MRCLASQKLWLRVLVPGIEGGEARSRDRRREGEGEVYRCPRAKHASYRLQYSTHYYTAPRQLPDLVYFQYFALFVDPISFEGQPYTQRPKKTTRAE